MTTKAQEREALAKIEKILESIDEDGWVGTAFEGCVEDAKTNIESDWALSMNGRWQDAEQTISRLRTEKEDLERRANDAEELASLQKKIAENAKRESEASTNAMNEWIKHYNEQADRADAAEARAEAAEAEIIKLKAKLYDFICGMQE